MTTNAIAAGTASPGGTPTDVTLATRRTRLEPLAAAHLPGLAAAIEDGRLWEIPVTTVPRPDELPTFLSDALARKAAGVDLPFAIVDAGSGRVVGSTRFRHMDVRGGRVEIGFTFVAAAWQRTHVNTEAKLLLLTHAFDVWRCNRVEFVTDVLNSRSREAIARLGASQEGILRKHMIMRSGRVRDSVLFSIIREEWPAVRDALARRLGRSDPAP